MKIEEETRRTVKLPFPSELRIPCPFVRNEELQLTTTTAATEDRRGIAPVIKSSGKVKWQSVALRGRET